LKYEGRCQTLEPMYRTSIIIVRRVG